MSFKNTNKMHITYLLSSAYSTKLPWFLAKPERHSNKLRDFDIDAHVALISHSFSLIRTGVDGAQTVMPVVNTSELMNFQEVCKTAPGVEGGLALNCRASRVHDGDRECGIPCTHWAQEVHSTEGLAPAGPCIITLKDPDYFQKWCQSPL